MAGKSKTSLGIEENLEAALAYLLGFVTGIIFLIVEKKSKFVRFHAMQSTVLFISILVIEIIFGFIPFIGWILVGLTNLAAIILWLLSMYKAYKGEKFKWPFVGEFAEKQL